MIQYDVRHGGLMRCCLASLQEAMTKATEPPKEGDTLECQYCSGSGSGGMVFRNDAWEWDRGKNFSR